MYSFEFIEQVGVGLCERSGILLHPIEVGVVNAPVDCWKLVFPVRFVRVVQPFAANPVGLRRR